MPVKEMKVACKRIGKACHSGPVFTVHEIAVEDLLRGNKGSSSFLSGRKKETAQRFAAVQSCHQSASPGLFQKARLSALRPMAYPLGNQDGYRKALHIPRCARLEPARTQASSVPRSFRFVAPLVGGRNFLVVSGNRIKGVVGNSVCHDRRFKNSDKLFPQRILWSRKLNGFPAQWPSSHSASLQRSTASGFTSTP